MMSEKEVSGDRLSSVTEWVRSLFGEDRPSNGYDDTECTHETENICPTEDHKIWHLTDTYLRGEEYWTSGDAAFSKCRERVNKYKCLGCGEERTITTGEVLEYRWKENMTTDELAEMHQKTTSGGWYNGQMWWEDNVWDGNPGDVASEMAWHVDIGYTDWKENTERQLQTEADQ